MHEDVDDYEPDMNAYYNMDAEEKRLRRALWRTTEKYYDGKISYEIYLRTLENDFFEILETKDWDEIAAFKKKQADEKAEKERIARIQEIESQKERDEFFKKLLIILVIVGLLVALFSKL